MKKFLQKIKDNQLLLDAVNVVCGFILIVALLAFVISQAYLALLVAVWAAGLINVGNGLKAMRRKRGVVFGQSMLMLGVIILIGGTALILSMMGLY